MAEDAQRTLPAAGEVVTFPSADPATGRVSARLVDPPPLAVAAEMQASSLARRLDVDVPALRWFAPPESGPERLLRGFVAPQLPGAIFLRADLTAKQLEWTLAHEFWHLAGREGCHSEKAADDFAVRATGIVGVDLSSGSEDLIDSLIAWAFTP